MDDTPKRARKRIEILKSAAASFQRRGYHGASVEQIASALNMTKGNLYYYFKNKEEILYVCHEHALEFMYSVTYPGGERDDPDRRGSR